MQRQSFSIDLHLDATKVAIPVGVNAHRGRETQPLLDLDHFTLKTDQVGIAKMSVEMTVR